MSSSTESDPTIAEMRKSDKRKRADTSTSLAVHIDSEPENNERRTKQRYDNIQVIEQIQKPKQSKRKKKQPEEDQPKHKKYLNIRTNPRQLFTLVSSLSEEQHAAVKEIGFGSLLEVKVSGCDAKLIKFLLKRLDVGRCSIQLEEDELCLEEEDVQNTLGVPRGQIPVVEGMSTNETPEYKDLVDEWRARWGIEKGTPSTTEMLNKIIQRRDHGDMFKRDFVIFVVTTLIKGYKNTYCNYRILHSLQDVNRIKDLNWCGYTIKSLLDSAEKWKLKQDSSYSGPATFLMLAYLDRVQVRGQVVTKNPPTISAWTTKEVRERISIENRLGDFGMGKVIGRKAILEQQPTQAPVQAESVQRVTDALKKMSSSIVEFGEVMAEIGTQNSAAEILRKTFTNFSNSVNPTPSPDPTPPETLLRDDDVFNQPSFLDAVAELEAAFFATMKSIHPDIAAPSFQLLTPTPPPSQPEATTSNTPNTQQAPPAAARSPPPPQTEAPTTKSTAAPSFELLTPTPPPPQPEATISNTPHTQQAPTAAARSPPPPQTEAATTKSTAMQQHTTSVAPPLPPAAQHEATPSPPSTPLATMLEALVEDISKEAAMQAQPHVQPSASTTTPTPPTPEEVEFERYTLNINGIISVYSSETLCVF